MNEPIVEDFDYSINLKPLTKQYPTYSYEKTTEVRPLESYTTDQIKNIKLVSLNPDEMAIPFGSASYRIQKYPGDLDLRENFIGCCTKKEVLDEFAVKLKRIIKNIKAKKSHYISEMKMGLDMRYDIDLGPVINGVFRPNIDNILIETTTLSYEKLLTQNETDIILSILDKDTHDADDYDVINYIFRERRIVRWKESDLLRGYVILPGGIKMTIRQALNYKTYVKIDVISYIDNKFVEMTNFFVIAYENTEGDLIPINMDIDINDMAQMLLNYHENMTSEIEKLYYSDMFYSPFKMVKRMWAYSRMFNIIQSIEALTPLVSSNISLLYMIKSEIEALIYVCKLTQKPGALVKKQIDSLKAKLSFVIEIDRDILLTIYLIIDDLMKPRVYSLDFINGLSKIKSICKKIINYHTIDYLNKVGSNPPPSKFLPDIMKYDPKLKRNRESDPMNPFEVAQELYLKFSPNRRKSKGKKKKQGKVKFTTKKVIPIEAYNLQALEVILGLPPSYEPQTKAEKESYNKIQKKYKNMRVNRDQDPNLYDSLLIKYHQLVNELDMYYEQEQLRRDEDMLIRQGKIKKD